MKAIINLPTLSTLFSKTCIKNTLIKQPNFTSQIIRTYVSDHDTAQLLIFINEQIQQYKYRRKITPNNIQDLIERLQLLDWTTIYKIP